MIFKSRPCFYLFSLILILGAIPLKGQNFNDRFATVSPDGTRILFESNRERPSHIFQVNLDGSGLTKLTTEGANAGPSWSSNGELIIYSKLRDRQFFDVYVQGINGQNIRQLTKDSSLNIASVLHDGWVYYTSNREHQDQLRRVSLNTQEDELLMTDAEHHNGISFSPDGLQTAMITKNEGNNWDIAIMDVSQRKIIREFPHEAREDSPQWSPVGNKILFSSNRDGAWGIFSFNSDGSHVTNLTNGQGNCRFASWYPDGSKIIFSSDREGNGYRLFTMNADGSNQQKLSIDNN